MDYFESVDQSLDEFRKKAKENGFDYFICVKKDAGKLIVYDDGNGFLKVENGKRVDGSEYLGSHVVE